MQAANKLLDEYHSFQACSCNVLENGTTASAKTDNSSVNYPRKAGRPFTPVLGPTSLNPFRCGPSPKSNCNSEREHEQAREEASSQDWRRS
jgi:hypothetical protein